METTARDLARIERRLREARGYSEGYGKLLHHSARKVLAESGFHLPDEERPIPIDGDAVETQIARFTDRPPSARRPRSSTAANYAENWRRFARWAREYLRAEAAGDEQMYLHKLGSGAPRRTRRAEPLQTAARIVALSDSSPRAMFAGGSEMFDDSLDHDAIDESEPERLYAYPSARAALAPDDRRVVTVKTSFGPYRIELPEELRAEDAARIAQAVLRAID